MLPAKSAALFSIAVLLISVAASPIQEGGRVDDAVLPLGAARGQFGAISPPTTAQASWRPWVGPDETRPPSTGLERPSMSRDPERLPAPMLNAKADLSLPSQSSNRLPADPFAMGYRVQVPGSLSSPEMAAFVDRLPSRQPEQDLIRPVNFALDNGKKWEARQAKRVAAYHYVASQATNEEREAWSNLYRSLKESGRTPTDAQISEFVEGLDRAQRAKLFRSALSFRAVSNLARSDDKRSGWIWPHKTSPTARFQLHPVSGKDEEGLNAFLGKVVGRIGEMDGLKLPTFSLGHLGDKAKARSLPLLRAVPLRRRR
ncbi:uncharacterized protein PFL1_02966 [Pseudozyma flocculosa PF-1]|uniref:Uncharacterized protein n=2 Tax=Pseudozyma flocculosa TaxID=84751 RepID=A0A5C3F4E2_9BASI|nr:uncharacterized protein PFL1_02966 [Pseudozyma flocculosa PF-1]EPQ29747.1 hypothetical protein PFL1_02966 [Pseudozyma flocculosa PF-1]SPO38329.1 uncharacterized protein PSFLO_03806 [Pseudozyma flocculosa]